MDTKQAAAWMDTKAAAWMDTKGGSMDGHKTSQGQISIAVPIRNLVTETLH